MRSLSALLCLLLLPLCGAFLFGNPSVLRPLPALPARSIAVVDAEWHQAAVFSLDGTQPYLTSTSSFPRIDNVRSADSFSAITITRPLALPPPLTSPTAHARVFYANNTVWSLLVERYNENTVVGYSLLNASVQSLFSFSADKFSTDDWLLASRPNGEPFPVLLDRFNVRWPLLNGTIFALNLTGIMAWHAGLLIEGDQLFLLCANVTQSTIWDPANVTFFAVNLTDATIQLHTVGLPLRLALHWLRCAVECNDARLSPTRPCQRQPESGVCAHYRRRPV